MHAHHDHRAGWQYRCADANRRGRSCPTGSILRRVVEPAIDERLEHDIANPDRLAGLLEAALEGETAATAQPDSEQATSRIRALQSERARVVTSYERGFRPLTDAETRIRQLDAEIEALEHATQTARETLEGSSQEVVELVTTAFSDWPDPR